MEHLKQFARRTFAEETERVTGGAVEWRSLPELRLEDILADVLSDGFTVIRRPRLLEHLAAPWPEAQAHSEVMLELKLGGDHLDRAAAQRALLRQQARLVQRLEEQESWEGDEPLWFVASHLPEWLAEMRSPVGFAPGCYWIDPPRHTFLWIAANELPLRDELIPFLMARSGQALDEFDRWVAQRRPAEWMLSMLEHLSRPMLIREEPPEDPARATRPRAAAGAC